MGVHSYLPNFELANANVPVLATIVKSVQFWPFLANAIDINLCQTWQFYERIHKLAKFGIVINQCKCAIFGKYQFVPNMAVL